MILFLYSDINYEHQAKACIKSLTGKITDDVKIVYFTIGFDSDFKFKNLQTVKLDFKPYVNFAFYKPEICFLVMQMFPNENYLYTDTDILFSSNFDFKKFNFNEPFPMGSYGPHEYPFFWEEKDGERIIFDEQKLMQYFNAPPRTMNYIQTCFFVFNENCKDFIDEWMSMCQNKYLMKDWRHYFPFSDETAFNVCLWKRNAKNSLGYIFINTTRLKVVQQIEEQKITGVFAFERPTSNIGMKQYDDGPEIVEDPNKVLFYHGIKEKNETEEILEYLLNRQKSL